ncbi:MAG TPA: TetR/AcrR family transcriptional regulator [Blastocatellia bacterium]|nr:TetR/AcrR family transcriptional regulator [Blastocatellia bacterium]
MNKKTEQKQKSREAIAASATSLLRERGIKASSVMDVMKGAGLTVGGFYSHYDSKEDLFVETLRNASSANWGHLLKSAKGDTPRSRTLSVIKQYLSRKHRDNKDAGCLLPSTAPEIARQGEPYRSALEKELSGFVDALADMIAAGAESREKALGLIALMYGALSLSRAVAGTRLSDEFLQAGRKLAERALADEEA